MLLLGEVLQIAVETLQCGLFLTVAATVALKGLHQAVGQCLQGGASTHQRDGAEGHGHLGRVLQLVVGFQDSVAEAGAEGFGHEPLAFVQVGDEPLVEPGRRVGTHEIAQ